MKENSFEDIKKLAGTKYFGSIVDSNGIVHLFSEINYYVKDGTFNIYKGEEGRHFNITSSNAVEAFYVDGLRVTTSIGTELYLERFDGKDWECAQSDHEGLRIAHKDKEKYLLLCSLFDLGFYKGNISDIEIINREGLRFRAMIYGNNRKVFSGIRYYECFNGSEELILPAFENCFFNSAGDLQCFDDSEEVTYKVIDKELFCKLGNAEIRGDIARLNIELANERARLLKQNVVSEVSVTKPIEVTEPISEYEIPNYLVSIQNSKNLFLDIMNNVKKL